MAIFCLSIFPAVSQEAKAETEVRTWTDITGQHTTQASFDRVEGEKVILQKDGEVIELEMSKLSAADQKYVKDYVEAFVGGNLEPDESATVHAEETDEGEAEEEPMVAEAEAEADESAQQGGEDSAAAEGQLSSWKRIMENKGSIFFLIMLLGFGVTLLGSLLLLVGAFSESVGWGLAVMFLPFAGIVFIFSRWERARAAVICWLMGIVLVFVGGQLSSNHSDSTKEARDAFEEGAVDDFESSTGLE